MKKHASLLCLLFVPPYFLILLFVYWYAIDRAPPLTLVYQHPTFLSRPVNAREEAKAVETSEASAGSSVWIWREICMKESANPGEAQAFWVEMQGAAQGAFTWSGPQRTFPPRGGCYGRSYEVTVPRAVGLELDYRLAVAFHVNPLVTARVILPPVRLWVLP